MDINSSSSEDESGGPSGDEDRTQQQPDAVGTLASDAVETLVISFNGGEPTISISGSSLGAVISKRTRGNVRDATAVHLILLAQPKLALCPLSLPCTR